MPGERSAPVYHISTRKADASAPAFCGESEIRTRDTLLGYTRFPGVPLQPLEHLSPEKGLQIYTNSLKNELLYAIS